VAFAKHRPHERRGRGSDRNHASAGGRGAADLAACCLRVVGATDSGTECEQRDDRESENSLHGVPSARAKQLERLCGIEHPRQPERRIVELSPTRFIG
jgi:hypothetical protein